MNTRTLKTYFLLLGLLAFMSCKKNTENAKPEEPAFIDPEMTYIDLTGKSVAMDKGLSIDFDLNGRADLTFRTERHSYDNNTKAADVYMVNNGVACNLALNVENDTTPDLQKGDKISREDMSKYEWYPVLEFTLMQYVYTSTQTYWEGSWKDRDHRYIPLEMIIGGKTHLGWVELFANTKAGKLVFYRAAISKTPQTRIRAGY